MQISLRASATSSSHPGPAAVTTTPWATDATAAPASFGQWLHSTEAQQVPSLAAPMAAVLPASQPGKSLALALPRPAPAPVSRTLSGNVGANANAMGSRNTVPARPRSSASSDPAAPARALATTGKQGGPPTTTDTATSPSAQAGPPAPPAIPLATPSACGWAAPRTGPDAAGDAPARSGEDMSPALQSVAQAMLRPAAASTASSPADGGDTLLVDPAGAGRLVFSAARLVTSGLSPTSWRAASAAANAAAGANAGSADGDAPIPLSAGGMAAPAGLPVDKALTGAIGLALAAASARQPDAQAGTASGDTSPVAAGLGERHPATLADTVASTMLPDAIGIAAPGAGPLATLAKVAELHEATIAPAVTDPAFAPALGAALTLLARDGVEQARLNLHPAEMGPITVQIAMDGTAARVDFQADVAATRAALQAALPALASALQEAGLSLSGGGVFQPSAEGQTTQGGAQSSQGQGSGAGQGGQGQPRRSGLLSPAAGSGAEPSRRIAKAPRGIVDLVA